MSSPLRIAFLGVDHPHGSGWRDMLANFDGQIEITALVPGFENQTASLEERYARIPRYESVESLIAEADFDGALICLPNDETPVVAEQLAQAGKHILVEKPVAASAHEVQRIKEAVESTGVAFQNGFMWRYDEGANRLKDMMDDGRFGKLISVEMTFVNSDVKRRSPDHYLFNPDTSGRGFFNWLASHFLDLLLYVTGEQVVGVTARSGVFGDTPVNVEDGGVAILDLSGGGIATFIGGYWLPQWAGEAHWTLRGSQRWVHWDPGKSLQLHGPKQQWYATEEVFKIPADNIPGYGGRRMRDLVQDWLQAAQAGGQPCRNTPNTTIDTLQLIDTLYQSSDEGRRIPCSIGSARR